MITRMVQFVQTLALMTSLFFTAKVYAIIPEQERNALMAIAETGQSEHLKQKWSGAAGTECEWQGVVCDEIEEHIIGLDISYRKIMQLSAEISHLQALTTLDLSGNDLTALPEQICAITGLIELNLSGNLLNSLPAACQQWQKLESLYLNSNQFVAIPEIIYFMSALSQLEAHHNKINVLSEQLGQLGSLTRLDLSTNDLKTLPPEIANFTALTYLNLAGTGIKSLPEALYSLTNLEYLDVSYNELTELSEDIINLKSLESLNISNNFLREIPIELTENPALGYIACGFNFSCQVNFIFRNNCLSDLFFGNPEDLTEEQTQIADWLKRFDNTGASFDYFGPIRDFCTIPEDKTNQFAVQNTHDGTGIRFVSLTLDARDTFFKEYKHYTIYYSQSVNEAGKRLSEGELTQIDAQTWQAAVDELYPFNKYVIVFSKPDANELGGFAAISMEFTKLPPEEEIYEGLNFTEMMLTQETELTKSFGHRVNLDYPVFVGDPTPISEILTIKGLAGLQQTSDGLVLHEGEKSFHARPALIVKNANDKSEFEYTDDNLYLLRTPNQRVITAVPGLADAFAFSGFLEKHQLVVEKTSDEGRMTIAPVSRQTQSYFYSAQADIVSTPAMEKEQPGLYFQEVDGLPNVKRAYYVYFDEKLNARRQAIPSRPFDWDRFKFDLERDAGFSEFSLMEDGFLLVVKGQQRYLAYADYRVDRDLEGDFPGLSKQYGVFPADDFNGDGVSDVVHKFRHYGNDYIQKIYLFP